jgi:hypothetical protein
MSLNSWKLNTRELAAELDRSPETIVRWRRLRKGPPFHRVFGRVLYDRAEVAAWLDLQRDDRAQSGAPNGVGR